MKRIAATILFLCLSSIGFGQAVSRDQKIQQIADLNARIKVLEDDILQPSPADLKQAAAEGFDVFRLMPREKYDHKLTVQGGGAYFSFTTGSHDYQKIAQISLEQNYLGTGFAGADYGLMADLGDVPLAGISRETREISFLVDYKPPSRLAEIRSEQRRANDYETNNITYRDRFPVSLSHVYALRSIIFGRADVLVGFKVIRREADGSMIIFWKPIETFPNPEIDREIEAANIK